MQKEMNMTESKEGLLAYDSLFLKIKCSKQLYFVPCGTYFYTDLLSQKSFEWLSDDSELSV